MKYLPMKKKPDLSIQPRYYAVQLIDPTGELRRDNIRAVLSSGTDRKAIEQVARDLSVHFAADRYAVQHKDQTHWLNAQDTASALEEFKAKFPSPRRERDGSISREAEMDVAFLELRQPGGASIQITCNRPAMPWTDRDQMEVSGKLDADHPIQRREMADRLAAAEAGFPEEMPQDED